MIIYTLYYLVFKILSSLVRDSPYHDMYYKGCGLLSAHKKSFNTAIPVRSLGPYMYVHYCTCIVHILVWTYLFLLTSFFDCLSFCGLFLKHPYKRFFPFYILYFYLSRFLSHHGATCVEVPPPCLPQNWWLNMSQSCRMVSMVLYFYYITMIIYILYYLVFKILSSLVRDSSYHDMYYKGCGLLCAHKKSFNTAIPVRSLGPYMYVHYCTCIVHILVWTYLFLLTSFFDCLSFCGLFLKHPYKRFSFLYSLFLPIEISLAPWCDVCGGSSSLLTTELVA